MRPIVGKSRPSQRDRAAGLEPGASAARATASAGDADPAPFVRRLEIEVAGSGRLWRSGRSAGLEDSEVAQGASASVDAASVVSFVDGLSLQQKEDVLHSTLLAQLAANAGHDRERDLGGWYEAYRTVLEGVGWASRALEEVGRPVARPELAAPRAVAIPGAAAAALGARVPGRVVPGELPRAPAFRLRPVVVDAPRLVPHRGVIDLLRPVSSGRDLSVTEAALGALMDLPDRDRRVVIFETSARGLHGGNFQVVVVKGAPDGAVTMTIAAFCFQTEERGTRVLTSSLGRRSARTFQARHLMTLDPAAYARARGEVIERLGDQAAAYIDDLRI